MLISSAARSRARHAGARQCLRTRAERALHQHRVDPAAEFEADGGKNPDVLEAERFVQPDRGDCFLPADYRDHLAVAELGAAFDQRRQQLAADTAPDLVGIDINRVLECIAVTNTRTERASIAIADNPPIALGDKIRQAARRDLAAAAGNFLDARRRLLEGGEAMQHVMAVNRGARGDVLVARWADRVIGALHSARGQMTRIGLPSRKPRMVLPDLA